MIKKSLLTFLILVAVLVAAGCQNSEPPVDLQGEIDMLKAQVVELTDENEALKAELAAIETEDPESLLELRNTLDSNLYGTLNALIRGENSAVTEAFTPSVEIEDGVITSLYGKGTVEFIIPEQPMNLRQRAFWQDGNTYNAIYEIYNSGYDTPDERLNTLNVLYLKQNDTWQIDAIFIDE
ncbi:hypothetical protein [Acidaminobacter hydrogenoformans]|uniref:DUF4829 domain-containing protein n=1 Tax=Acidaminobacter hydrogenoformans DSM 2784 TaxID=1120920 RepID=A0A1G5S5K1_9FIRM|nr:hypothetical protein [Acidaminobacter hydrogenoformans]SCZ81692.1 hypothetical protein SAMN03080599_02947 [Acidaminobacter hydrogenoformans DSM 2784]